MPTLDQIPAVDEPVHLLLIAPTKIGKSTYAAQAAIAGFTMVYFDSDNGVTALRNAFKSSPEGAKRTHYFYIENPKTFWYRFLRSNAKTPLHWNARTQREWGPASLGSEPDDVIWIFDVTKIPASWILALDSWTSFSADALGIGSATGAAELLNGTNQGIYGEANNYATYVCNVLQKIHCHVLVQAHDTKYEIYEKPNNTLGSKMKQGEMTLLETVDIPVSTSRPHGYSMGSRFNHIGWLSVNGAGNTDIDFMRKPNRVGGGPPNKKADTKSLGFKELVGHVPAKVDPSEYEGWFRQSTHAQLIAEREAAKAAPANTVPPAGSTIQAPAAAAKPTVSLAGMLKK